jgi:V/A-type H+-transporting ATPase subunit A
MKKDKLNQDELHKDVLNKDELHQDELYKGGLNKDDLHQDVLYKDELNQIDLKLDKMEQEKMVQDKVIKGKIQRISGPVVYAQLVGKINDVVKVGSDKLMGEIIEIRGSLCVIQVYEDTVGLKPGDVVENTNEPLSVELGPGILSQVFDGTQRPLDVIKKQYGCYIARGVDLSSLDRSKKWDFVPVAQNGSDVFSGQVIGTVRENSTVVHKIMVPLGVSGKITCLKKAPFTIDDTIAKVADVSITLTQKWPVRRARPFKERLEIKKPLLSGIRVIDYLFPIAMGGAAAIPGPFGCGKTVTQQQFARWCDADIIVYVGCGERGNEMTEVLDEFPHLKDPKSGQPLMNRTILIANTSNMPVAAREASIYTGITIAEYFRDQGFNVALMADSTSRWAEAMREISGRLEEMPGEEGYPAYLSKKLADFYERSGIVKTLGDDEGSISIIGAVSPAGGDFSEPVTQNTLRLTKCFWALDSKLADKRHYYAINWLTSYSLFTNLTDTWFDENVSSEWSGFRKRIAKTLQRESELQEIVQLVGLDSLPKEEQLLMLIAKSLREDFLQQNAFVEEDAFCSSNKQIFMAKSILNFYDKLLEKVDLINLEEVRESKVLEILSLLKYEDNKIFVEGKTLEIENKLNSESNSLWSVKNE